VRAFPVDVDVFEAHVAEEVLRFGQAPKPPVVGEGAVEARSVPEAEVNVRQGFSADRVELLLIPRVGEPLQTSGFGIDTRGLRSLPIGRGKATRPARAICGSS
jgi:hypothetical protein